MGKSVLLTIDGQEVQVVEGTTILQAAQQANIYIPALCAHPDLPPAPGLTGQHTIYRGGSPVTSDDEGKGFEGCQLCLVEIEGREGFSTACSTPVAPGMVISTNTPQLHEARQNKLMNILASHPHACLTCEQREGCAREPCSMKVDVNVRCCSKFGRCELQNISEYIGIKKETPRYIFRDLPSEKNEPLFTRDYNLCIGCLRCVRACNDLRGVKALGFVFQNGKAVVGTVAPSLRDSACRFCGACVEVCPTGALMDKVVEWAKRQQELVPCISACPVNLEIPTYVRLIAQKRFSESAAVIRERLPLPLIVSHVCPHPCEQKCRHTELNEPIAICNLKRLAAEHDTGLWKDKVKVSPPTGKRVAIIGSGPAGLTAAYYLSRLGHSVTVFEAHSQAGGMMRQVIPRYRLSADLVDKEVSQIFTNGIEFRPNTTVGKDISFAQLRQEFDSIFIAVGAGLSRTLPQLSGIELKGVILAVPFLMEMNQGKKPEIGDKVVVVGGGNVAMDVARSALRIGAREVNVVCLESGGEMLCHPWEREEAEEEGVKIHNSLGPKRLIGENNRVKQIEFLRVKSIFDEQGRFNPTYIPDTESVFECDTVIIAIGQAAGLGFLDGSLTLAPGGWIKADPTTLETSLPGVFAGGDVVTGPVSIIAAVGAGRRAAISIDHFFGGEGVIEDTFLEREKPNSWLGREEGFASKPRVQMPCLSVRERLKGFSTVELGFPEEGAIAEAGRCLQCDLRLHISSVAAPPEKVTWLGFTRENVEATPEIAGVYQLLDENHKVIYIAGVMNLRQELMKKLEDSQPPWNTVRYFVYEQNDMYTAKESELLQQFIQVHGRMPQGNEASLGDLF